MKVLVDRVFVDEILSCFDKIKKLELAMESLPNNSIAEWREREKIKEKEERLQAEIIQLRGILEYKLNSNSLKKYEKCANY